MIILALESSGGVASVAIWKDGQVLTEGRGPFKVTHSETLMPLVQDAFNAVTAEGIDKESIDLIAVSGGPGSFTGLRIGNATAKGLGFALKKDLIHVPTIDAMAYNFKGSGKLIVPMMDARRGQVYTGIYCFDGGELKTIKPGCAIEAVQLISIINEIAGGKAEECSIPGEVIFLGDGAVEFREMIENGCNVPYEFANGDNALQRASSVARLAAVLAERGEIVKAGDEIPEYLRLSQAERIRQEQVNQAETDTSGRSDRVMHKQTNRGREQARNN
ncbi:MAG: tRNA (adenosine(37)-N6)-threonylcarbamoyltransferase complex dimerization subunit type 1 TsaB [Lachnospiraceae bacterium]|jgi:tRNA threonylcarbamoyladenosine biosynthesis protein TsaB